MKAKHDGEMVKAAVNASTNAKEFAEQMGLHRNTIYKLFKNPNWSTDKLEKAGEILGISFITYSQEQPIKLVSSKITKHGEGVIAFLELDIKLPGLDGPE